MRLRRLAVYGFKTFASRAEVTFDRGITAVVGPNGSGKSNLVDALRWALGETNARELRGQRMDEVVYSGGGRRPRTSVAEVELVIDNAEGRLAVDDPEVAISRRVVRGAADTEYRLNGERVRLRDLERLLGATGLTQNGYAVVAQNDIDGIIEATPGQRRVLVEQAAGVRSLRAACEDAVGRVAVAEAVLRRIGDLLDDAEPRLEELAAQAEAALAQRELGQRLSELRGSLAREAWRAARGRLKQARRRLDQASGRWEAATEAETGFAERASAARARLEALRAARDAARQELEQARLAAERAGADARQWHERLRAAVLRRAMAREERDAAHADAMSAAAASTRLEGVRRQDDGNRVDGVRDRCAALRRSAAEVDAELAGAEQAVAQAAAEDGTAAVARHDAEAAMREARLQLDLFDNAATALDADQSAATAAVQRAATELAAAAATEADATGAGRVAEAELVSAQAAAEAAWDQVNAAEERSAERAAAARRCLARAAEARGRLSGTLGGSGGVARAVEQGALQARRLAGAVRVREAGDAVAIEAALEGHAAAWLVDDAAAAAGWLDPAGAREELLDARRGGEEDASPPHPWRRAIDAVDVSPDVRDAVVDVLRGVWLVESAAAAPAALAAGARVVVLPDGRAMERRRVRGGSPSPALHLAAEDLDAAREAERAGAEEAAAIVEVAAARERLSAAEAGVAAVQSAVLAARAATSAAGARRAALEREAEEAEARLTRARAARGERDGRRDASEQSLTEAALRLEAASRRAAEARAALERAEERRGRERTRAAAAADEARAAELELARAEGAVAEAADRAGELTQAVAAAEARRETARARMADAELEALGALTHGRAARTAAVTAADAVIAVAQRSETAHPELEEMERVLVALESEHAEVAVALARAEDERAAAGTEVAAAETELEHVAEAAREDGEDEADDWDPQAADRAEREIVRLERRVAALGPVNALAPEQHRALEARVSALREHREDLDVACSDVRAIARGLSIELERRFDEVFEAVSFQFQTLFAELFPGGHAGLRLEAPDPEDGDGEDVTERRPGVEILAQPSGKRLGPLRLLSGGERALTALAVVLALQQVNPSPFYVFDEVDAALDDSNVLRFTRLLRRLAAEQQFIVVTHNHITMAAADVLWGITIDADGVSSVLGVRFDGDARAGEIAVPGLQRLTARAAR